jgi:uncharacterized membrane protein
MLRKLMIGLAILAIPGTAALAVGTAAGQRGLQALGLDHDGAQTPRRARHGARQDALRTRSDIRARRAELAELMRAPNLDRGAVDQKVNEILDLQARAFRARVEAALQARQALSPEQRQGLRDTAGPQGRRHRQPPPEGGDAPPAPPQQGAGPA